MRFPLPSLNILIPMLTVNFISPFLHPPPPQQPPTVYHVTVGATASLQPAGQEPQQVHPRTIPYTACQPARSPSADETEHAPGEK